MTRPSMQYLGLDELRQMMGDIAPRIARNILRATVYGVAVQVKDRLKERVAKRTSRLEKSLFARRKKSPPDNPQAEVRGGHDAPYMLMLEYGTEKTAPQPFIMPTVEEMSPELPEIYREQFAQKFEKALAREAKRQAKLAAKLNEGG